MEPRDVVQVELTCTGRVELVEIVGDSGILPREPERNCATHVAQDVLRKFGDASTGLRVRLWKGLPLGSGLGSSAASGVAAAVATASLLDATIPKEALLDSCREGERLATGSPHPDNAAPSLFGGLVACIPRHGEDIEVVSLRAPADLFFVCVKPGFSVATQMARERVPRHVPMSDCVANMGNLAGVVAALAQGDMGLLGRCMHDRLATPYRAPLIDGFEELMRVAQKAGAIGSGISGSGPTLFAVCDAEESALRVRADMVAAFRERGHESLAIISAIDPAGARLEQNDIFPRA